VRDWIGILSILSMNYIFSEISNTNVTKAMKRKIHVYAFIWIRMLDVNKSTEAKKDGDSRNARPQSSRSIKISDRERNDSGEGLGITDNNKIIKAFKRNGKEHLETCLNRIPKLFYQ
jgi:hypothetical protein